jgi:signal transduction histidine kinase
VSAASAIDPEAEYEALLKLLYSAPIGLVQILLDGEIVLINPLSAQLLMPLSRDGALSNLFTALEYVAPDLRHLVGRFAAGYGTVCDDLRFEVKSGIAGTLEPKVLSLSLVKLDADRLMAVLSDVTVQVERERQLEEYREHLEQLVAARTAALERANAAAAAAHSASLTRLNAERDAKLQSSKLEAVGTLAAGIAHDFNNILASIIACAELAEEELADGSQAKNNVEKVISGCFRGRDLVARMLDFARERRGDPMTVNIEFQVREALALLRASLRPSIDLAFQSSTGPSAAILADPTQIMQIVMNLCINAAHAMDNHGVIGIRLDPAASIKNAPPDQQAGICITVADTGTGMTPEIMERMFDPFFTTKAPGAGSGLGLSVVYGIVKSLGGEIKVQSSMALLGTGTQFQVFMPIIQQADNP